MGEQCQHRHRGPGRAASPWAAKSLGQEGKGRSLRDHSTVKEDAEMHQACMGGCPRLLPIACPVAPAWLHSSTGRSSVITEGGEPSGIRASSLQSHQPSLPWPPHLGWEAQPAGRPAPSPQHTPARPRVRVPLQEPALHPALPWDPQVTGMLGKASCSQSLLSIVAFLSSSFFIAALHYLAASSPSPRYHNRHRDFRDLYDISSSRSCTGAM